MITFDIWTALASFAMILYLNRRWKNSIHGLPLPPGPKKLPLIGNILDMPTSLEWETYHEWCKEFDSDIIHLDMAGTSIIVLDTAEAAVELFEKKSSIYSNRPRMPMLRELCGYDYIFAFMEYGGYWREQRKLFHMSFHPTAAMLFQPQELKAAHGLLRRLLDEPKTDLSEHIRQMAGETIMSIAYGLDVLPKNDPLIQAAEEGIRVVALASIPGRFLVDSIPFLKYVPEWMPFAGFKRKAREWRKAAHKMNHVPFEAAMRRIKTDENAPSFVSRSLENVDHSRDLDHQETVIKSTAGTMFLAGADTTTSIIASCILAFLANPEALKKGQQEIDAVVPPGELPDFGHQDSLPYITAIVKEALRWREIAPIGLPHLLDADDEYKGYRLPAGSLIIGNIWAMLHDETTYPDPFTFNPDRFMKDGKLDPSIKDPAHAAFGFGRRVCPGRYVAFSATWITIVSIVATFDITKAVDENGNTIEPSFEYETGAACRPLPFKCSIRPRSKQAEALIRATASNHS